MTTLHPKRLLSGVLVMAVCIAGGMLFSMFVKDSGTGVSRILMALGVVAVTVPTFEWGAKRGFRVQDEEGRIHLEHVARCAVMTLIMAAVGAFIGGIIFSVTFAALR